jgi:hypothetical protein
MRGSLWTIVVAAIGAAVVLRGAGQAVPSSPASSTTDVVGVLNQVSPFAGQLLLVAAVATLILIGLRVE